jgi:hypothetical protein
MAPGSASLHGELALDLLFETRARDCLYPKKITNTMYREMVVRRWWYILPCIYDGVGIRYVGERELLADSTGYYIHAFDRR